MTQSAHTDNMSVWVTFQVEGTHCYPQALTDPSLVDVAFLGHPHRHVFHFEVELSVDHDDRDVEFILLKRELLSLYNGVMSADSQSCEMMAKKLAAYIDSAYPGKLITIKVSEDGENGATLRRKYHEY